jgi:hypothetical protein
LTTRQPQPAFPLLKTLITLSGVALVLFGLCAWAIPAVFGHPPRALAGVTAMAAVVAFSLLLSVLPVGLLGSWGVMATVYGYFFGAAARFVICIVAGFVLVKVQGLPAAPVMVTMPVMYLPLMFIETGLVGRYLWKKDSLPKGADANVAAAQKEALA